MLSQTEGNIGTTSRTLRSRSPSSDSSRLWTLREVYDNLVAIKLTPDENNKLDNLKILLSNVFVFEVQYILNETIIARNLNTRDLVASFAQAWDYYEFMQLVEGGENIIGESYTLLGGRFGELIKGLQRCGRWIIKAWSEVYVQQEEEVYIQ